MSRSGCSRRPPGRAAGRVNKENRQWGGLGGVASLTSSAGSRDGWRTPSFDGWCAHCLAWQLKNEGGRAVTARVETGQALSRSGCPGHFPDGAEQWYQPNRGAHRRGTHVVAGSRSPDGGRACCTSWRSEIGKGSRTVAILHGGPRRGAPGPLPLLWTCTIDAFQAVSTGRVLPLPPVGVPSSDP